MLVHELESRLNSGLQDLELTFQQQYGLWQQEYSELQQQLEQSQLRESHLRQQNTRLISELNAKGAVPDSDPLLQKVRMLAAHINVLAEEAAAFRRSCQE